MTPPIQVLMIENHPADAELTRRTLLKETHPPFAVEWVDRLALGLERLARGGVDVVVLDLGPPDSNGLATFSRVYERARDVPIVILTGSYQDDAMALQAVQQGAQDYLMKDQIGGETLARVVRYAIQRKQSERELRAANQELKRQLDDIAWLNRMAMDREHLTLTLKQEVDTLLQALGRPKKYGV